MFKLFRKSNKAEQEKENHLQQMKANKDKAIQKEIERLQASKKRVRNQLINALEKQGKQLPQHYIETWKEADKQILKQAEENINKQYPAFATV